MREHPWDRPGNGGPPDIELPPKITRHGSASSGAKAEAPKGNRTPPWAWVTLAAVVGAAGYLRLETEGTLSEPMGASSSRAEVPGSSGGPTPPSRADPAHTYLSGSAPADLPDAAADDFVRMEYLQGDGQEADVGTLLPMAFAVELMGASGRPLVGVEVRFRVIFGGGTATPSVVRTDRMGRASTAWRLGPGPGFQRLAATGTRVATPVTFTAIAREVTGLAGGEASEALASRTPTVPVPGRADPQPSAAGPRPVTVVTSDFVVGGSMVCVLRSRRVTCRGAADRGQRIERDAAGSRAVVAGLFHACVLDASGVASCWGANQSGQLGDGSETDRSVPVRVATPLRFSMLSAGAAHTCGLADGGRLACWGENLGGQLGDGSREDRTTPALVSTTPFESLVSGWSHTCAVTRTGALYCWGLNREGQVGDGSRLDGLTPKAVGASDGVLAAGSSHTCAISAGRLLCWGDNRFGQLGDGTTESRLDPTPVTGIPGAPLTVVAGASHTCVLLSDGTGHCWGQNLHGQLGDSSTTNAATPVPVAGGLTFARLTAGGAVTCGRTVDGVEYCWGLNQSGQLGDGTLDSRQVPTRVGG